MADFTWTPETLVHYPLISSVAISPDGSQIAYTTRIPYMTNDKSEFRHQLWLANCDGSENPRLLAFGDTAEMPRWSPDGSTIAFLRNSAAKECKEDTKAIWLIPADGGEAKCLIEDNCIHKSISAYEWSPDGKHIAFVAPPYDSEHEKSLRERNDVIHWREDFPFAQLFVINIPNTAPTTSVDKPPTVKQLTDGRRHITSLAWSLDSALIAYTHQENTLDDRWTTLQLAVIATDGSVESRDLGAVTNREGSPAFSPDGQWIACEAGIENNHWPYAGNIHLFPVSGGDARALAAVSDEQPVLVGWDVEGTGIYTVNQTGLASELVYLPADGSEAVSVCTSGKLLTARDVNAQGDIAVVLEDFHERQSIYVGTLAAEQECTLKPAATPSSEYPHGPLPQVRTLSWKSIDDFEIEGILYLPEEYDQSRDGAIPLLLHIHGGPMAIFQRQFAATPYYYTPAALCERGIAVLRCNPRGSGGYGKEFRFANMKDWGGGDYQDIQKGVDTVVEMGIADPERLGIAGWSYGGFMTSWTITQTDRYAAASIGAAVTNPMSFCGTADLPSFIPDYFGGEAWEIPEFYNAHSPIAHVAKARTPAIVQHGGADERVPLEQGLQYFNALKRQGVRVDMYIYPRQGHAIDEPRLLVDAMGKNLDWFTKMLTDSEE